jgi:hypothetical protein
MSLFCSVCKWQKSIKDIVKDIVPSLKWAMQMAGSVASSQQRQVQEERSQIDRWAQEEQVLRCALIALMDEEGRDLEELEAMDSANLIQNLAVDADRVLSDRTDAHMNNLVSGVCTTERSFGKSDQRPSNGTAAVNILKHGDISSGCLRDSSDNLMTNSTSHCFMGVSHENAFTPPLVPGNVMTGTCNCNCNFDMNMFLKHVKNSVS